MVYVAHTVIIIVIRRAQPPKTEAVVAYIGARGLGIIVDFNAPLKVNNMIGIKVIGGIGDFLEAGQENLVRGGRKKAAFDWLC
jgi:hypothetical protein